MARKKDVELHRKNPFLTQLAGMKTRRKRTIARGGKAIIDVQTGELEDVAEIVSIQQVDNAQFVKVFTSNLKHFFNLKPTTFRLVQVLLHQLGALHSVILFISTFQLLRTILPKPNNVELAARHTTRRQKSYSKRALSLKAQTQTYTG